MSSNPKNTSGLVLFAFCVCIACAIWLVSNFAKNYQKHYLYPVTFTSLPSGKTTETNATTLDATIQATGWQMLFSNFKQQKIVIDLQDIDEVVPKTFSSTELVTNTIANGKVLQVNPSFLSVELVDLEGKMVPVAIDYELDLDKNYFLVEEPLAFPDSVFIAGSMDLLDTLFQVHTKPLIINGKKSNEKNIGLVSLPETQIATQEVRIQYNIEEFTEVVFEVPIGTKNLDEGLDYMIYPEVVEVSCVVPFSKYETLIASNFEVVIDADNANFEKSDKVALKLEREPNFVKNVQISPEVVNLIIYK